MDYTKEFEKLIDPSREIKEAKAFILFNDRPKKIKVFPEEIGIVLAEKYIENIQHQVNGKEFVSYIPDSVEILLKSPLCKFSRPTESLCGKRCLMLEKACH